MKEKNAGGCLETTFVTGGDLEFFQMRGFFPEEFVL